MRKIRSLASTEAMLNPAFQRLRLDSLTKRSFQEIDPHFEAAMSYDKAQELHHEISDRWECVKNNTKRKFKENFSKSDTLNDAMDFVLNCFNKIKSPNSDYIFYQYEKKWQIVEYHETICGNGTNGAAIPINFFPALKKKDKPLYRLLADTFHIMAVKTNMDSSTIGGGGEYEDFGAERIDEIVCSTEGEFDKEEIALAKKYRASHIKGNIKKSFDEILVPRKIYWDTMESEIIPKEFSIPEAAKWAKEMLSFLKKESHHLKEFDFHLEDPMHEDGFPVFYSQTLGFYWHQNDIFHCEVNSMLNCNAQEHGVANPVEYVIWDNRAKRGELTGTKWPLEFYKLCEKFNNKIEPLITEKYGITDGNY